MNPLLAKSEWTFCSACSTELIKVLGSSVASGIARSSAQTTLSTCTWTSWRTCCNGPWSASQTLIWCTTSAINIWNTQSASGDPGLVPLLVTMVDRSAGACIHVSVCRSCRSWIRKGGAPSCCRRHGNSKALATSWAGNPSSRRAFSTTSTSSGTCTPDTSSLISLWKAFAKSMKTTAEEIAWASMMRPNVRKTCDPNGTCMEGNPPIWPCGRWRCRRAMRRVRIKAWNLLANVGRSIIPR